MTALVLVWDAFRASLRNPPATGVWGLAALLVVLMVAVGSPLAGYPIGADVDASARSLGPSPEHWLGTDHLGRDVFWRLLLASRAFVGPGVLACTVAAGLGIPLGAATGWTQGAVRQTLRLLLDSVMSVPRLVLVLLVCAIYGAGPLQLALAAGLAATPPLALAIAARIEGLRHAEFVLAARAHGVPAWRLLFAHLVGAACGRTIARQLLATFGSFMVLECTLSYLGALGVPEPVPSWGNMLAFEFGHGWTAAAVAPGVALWLAVLATAAASTLFAEHDHA